MLEVTPRPLPRHPILDWSSFFSVGSTPISSIENLRHQAFTTSGRAAIYQALLQLKLPRGSTVLVPSYHCPTMIAPIFLAHLKVAYFAITEEGLPNLLSIDDTTSDGCKAMLVSHYFGFANSLHAVRAWCDARNISLIEDCAHCYFGRAGERSVGAWGDYSTASISKFFPVQEGGVLASDTRIISNLNLEPATFKDQIKGFLDVVETSNKYGGFKGLNTSVNFLLRIKKIFKINKKKIMQPQNEEIIKYCDMGRINIKMLWSSFFINKFLPRKFISEKRRKNYFQYERIFFNTAGAHPLLTIKDNFSTEISPYVFPLWVDDADRIYQSLKAMGLPVFRWDKIWPGTPQLVNDAGPGWCVHVLQLLCHQNLGETEINLISSAILKLLPNQAA